MSFSGLQSGGNGFPQTPLLCSTVPFITSNPENLFSDTKR